MEEQTDETQIVGVETKGIDVVHVLIDVTRELYNEDADPEPVFRDAGKYTVYLFGEGDYRGYEEKNFYIIPPEEKLNRMLKNAEEDVDEAQLRVDLLSDSDSAKEVEAAYRQLVKAQQKLIEAVEMLILSNELL